MIGTSEESSQKIPAISAMVIFLTTAVLYLVDNVYFLAKTNGKLQQRDALCPRGMQKKSWYTKVLLFR